MGPTSTILPSESAATRSQTVCRLSRSWVTIKTVRPSVCCSVVISTSKSPAEIGSSPEVGSSRNTISGSRASARPAPRAWSSRPTARTGTCCGRPAIGQPFRVWLSRVHRARSRKSPNSRALETAHFAGRSARKTTHPAETRCPNAGLCRAWQRYQHNRILRPKSRCGLRAWDQTNNGSKQNRFATA